MQGGRPGVGRTPGSAEHVQDPDTANFGGKISRALCKAVVEASILRDGGNRPTASIKGGEEHPFLTHHTLVILRLVELG
jgi:hypothetical protein